MFLVIINIQFFFFDRWSFVLGLTKIVYIEIDHGNIHFENKIKGIKNKRCYILKDKSIFKSTFYYSLLIKKNKK